MPATKTKPTVASIIKHLYPCDDAKAWGQGYTSPEKAWKECQRGDWMLWLLGKQARDPESDARKKLVACACECARLALPYTTDGRVLACIETAERWSGGGATIEELREARKSTTAAAYAAAYAADAAYAAYAAAAAAAAAAELAGAAAAYAADAYAAGTKTLARCADIVRKHYPKPPRIKEKANADSRIDL